VNEGEILDEICNAQVYVLEENVKANDDENRWFLINRLHGDRHIDSDVV